MGFKNLVCILSVIMLFGACVKEDYFGESEFANVKKFVVSNQASNSIINGKNYTVTVEIPGGVDLSEITVQTLELSSFSTSDLKVGDMIDLNNEVLFSVTSENGTTQTWTVKAFIASSTPQLDNFDLNLWYKTATEYYEPGESAANTIWGTGNRGTQILNKLATVPTDLGGGNIAAKMETLSNGVLGGVFGAPISSGSIFTGVFNADNIDPANPEAAIEFGTPFSGRPDKLRITYKYTPGAVNKDKPGTVLSYSDACDIYALLEVRLNGTVERLATAWFRSEDEQTEMLTIEIPFTYGALDASFPNYMQPGNNLYVDPLSVDFILPTHITFVASSSFDGANFAGAVGSLLVVDNVEMVYD